MSDANNRAVTTGSEDAIRKTIKYASFAGFMLIEGIMLLFAVLGIPAILIAMHVFTSPLLPSLFSNLIIIFVLVIFFIILLLSGFDEEFRPPEKMTLWSYLTIGSILFIEGSGASIVYNGIRKWLPFQSLYYFLSMHFIVVVTVCIVIIGVILFVGAVRDRDMKGRKYTMDEFWRIGKIKKDNRRMHPIRPRTNSEPEPPKQPTPIKELYHFYDDTTVNGVEFEIISLHASTSSDIYSYESRYRDKLFIDRLVECGESCGADMDKKTGLFVEKHWQRIPRSTRKSCCFVFPRWLRNGQITCPSDDGGVAERVGYGNWCNTYYENGIEHHRTYCLLCRIED